jgi:TetR/AcrR family transcriptional regulator, cholesterol catabolism regulator
MPPESVRSTSESNTATTVRGRALIALREMLLKGEFPPGKRLEEVELSRRLCVSRPVLRSVLDRLSSEGLLELAAPGGYTARRFTLEDIRDAILARATLEGLAACLAAKRFQDRTELEAARKLNAELAEAISSRPPGPPSPANMARFGDLNAAFHAAIVAAARSPMLSWCLERVQSAAFASPAAVVLAADGGGGAQRAFQEHEAILNAIEARDPARAESLLKEHAALAIQAIESALDGQPHTGRNIALALVGQKPAKLTTLRTSRPAKQAARGSRLASGSTSARILDAAADLFCEKGFFASSTRELAACLNIQQGSLYHHMSKKEDLLHRICRQVIDRFLEDLPTALNNAALNNGEGGRSRIDAFIDAHLGAMLYNPRHTLAMVTEFRALSRPHFAEITEKYKEYSRLLESELLAARASESLRTDISPKHIRLALLNVLNWTPRWFHPRGALSCKDLSSIYERVFWEGVIGPKLARMPEISPIKVRQARDKHRGTLGKFIRGAAELFARQGYDSTSTRSLATLLGMEKATLYYHVESKEDLLYVICKSSIEQITSDVNEAISGVDDPLEQLRVLIQAHVASLLRDQTQHLTSLAEARALSPDRLAEIVGMRKAYQVRIRSLIEAGQKAGCIRADISSKYLGLILEGLLDRTVVWYRRGGELKPSELGATLCELYFTGARLRA